MSDKDIKKIEKLLNEIVYTLNKCDEGERPYLLGAGLEILLFNTWIDKLTRLGIVMTLLKRVWLGDERK